MRDCLLKLKPQSTLFRFFILVSPTNRLWSFDEGVFCMFEPGRAVRVGLIGYGYAGKTFHAPLVQSVEGLELTVVGSSKRDTVLADRPGVTVCSDMLEVATHSEVD